LRVEATNETRDRGIGPQGGRRDSWSMTTETKRRNELSLAVHLAAGTGAIAS
jgi:hypothetical protein